MLNEELFGSRPLHWYTGKPPVHGVCPGVNDKTNNIHSLPLLDLKNCSKEAVRNYFDNTWTMTEVLYASIQGPDSFSTPPPHNLRHPLIFYYGHPAVLYINKLRVAGLVKEPLNAYYESLFETGVDEMSWDDMSKNHMAWPTVRQVHKYRQDVYNTIVDLIESTPDAAFKNIDRASPLWALLMSMEHERIHIETSSVLMRESSIKNFIFPQNWPPYHTASIPTRNITNPRQGEHYPANELIAVTGGSVTLGRDASKVHNSSYGWDNEFGSRSYDVKSFKASKLLVSNGEFLDFVKDNGYSNQKYWTDVGWKWRTYNNAKFPTFWKLNGPQGLHDYKLRLIFSEVNMPYNWPVNVNYHEAKAFCEWKSEKKGKRIRLTTELEHALLETKTEDAVVAVNETATMVEDKGINANLSLSSEYPVNASKPSSKGFHDVHGNVWQWQEDNFSALDNFSIHPYYEDFSTPCFDGLHNVIKGGSFMSTGNEASVHARFHFRPHFFQHAGFRYTEQEDDAGDFMTSCTDAPGPWVGHYPFKESSALKKLKTEARAVEKLNSTIASAYGALPSSIAALLTSGGSARFEEAIFETIRKYNNEEGGRKKALEVGCGVGGLSFLLASDFNSINAIDAELPNITVAKGIQSSGKVSISATEEGKVLNEVVVAAPNHAKAVKSIEFRQADPSCIPAEYIDFDAVVINHVLEKVPAPNSVLGRLDSRRGLVKVGGYLYVLASYNWNSSVTPSSLWIQGQHGLVQRLSPSFKLMESKELVKVQAASDRSFDGSVLQLNVFKRLS